MNEEMSKRLSAFVGSDTLVSIYSDIDEPDTFTFGYLIQMDKDYVLVNLIDSVGEENGFAIINMNDIFIFDIDKMYSARIQKIFEIKKQKRRYIENADNESIMSFLNYALSNNLMIIVNDDDNFMGYVIEYSKETLVLHLIDKYASDIGTAVIDMKNINTLDCETKFLKALELLCEH